MWILKAEAAGVDVAIFVSLYSGVFYQFKSNSVLDLMLKNLTYFLKCMYIKPQKKGMVVDVADLPPKIC